jgi:hypothetical protein
MPRAALAIALVLGPAMVPGDPEALHLLCHGASEFLRAEPWRHWDDDEVIEIVLGGAVAGALEAAVMGAAGKEYGVALYRRGGAIARVVRGVDRGRMAAAAREDGLLLTLDDEPRFAIAALRDAYGLDRVPIPMKMQGGGARALDCTDVAILGGALRLLATVTPAGLDGDLRRRTGDLDRDRGTAAGVVTGARAAGAGNRRVSDPWSRVSGCVSSAWIPAAASAATA